MNATVGSPNRKEQRSRPRRHALHHQLLLAYTNAIQHLARAVQTQRARWRGSVKAHFFSVFDFSTSPTRAGHNRLVPNPVPGEGVSTLLGRRHHPKLDGVGGWVHEQVVVQNVRLRQVDAVHRHGCHLPVAGTPVHGRQLKESTASTRHCNGCTADPGAADHVICIRHWHIQRSTYIRRR